MSSFCPGCGTSMAEGEPVCSKCGRDASPSAPTTPALDPQVAFGLPPENSGKAIFSIVCSVALLALPLVMIGGTNSSYQQFFYALLGVIIVLSIPIALVAVIFGHLARFEIRRSAGRLKGMGVALTGLVLGYVEVAAIVSLIVVGVVAMQRAKAGVASRTKTGTTGRVSAGRVSAARVTPAVTTNQPSAVSAVRSLNTAEIAYAQAHPAVGYTCSVDELAKAWGIAGDLNQTNKDNYRIALRGCAAAKPGGPMTKYQVVAYPVPGRATLPAFCSDQSDTIKVDWNGSPEGCLGKGAAWNGLEERHIQSVTLTPPQNSTPMKPR